MTGKELSPIGGAVVFIFLFIHLYEANFPRCVYVCITCFFAKLIVICAEFVNNQSCRWSLRRGREREKVSQMESDIYFETAVDPVIYIPAYTAITMCLSVCSSGSQ